MSTLKDQKQQFVSDLLGGSLVEIYTVVGVSIVSIFAFQSFVKLLGPDTQGYLHLLHDIYFNVLVLVISVTSYSNHISLLNSALGLVLVALLILSQVIGNKSTTNDIKKSEVALLAPKGFITAYRSHMLILTNISILAVDFHVFPRRFAKVETWGTSIMDMGVGSFVFSMGVVNSRSLIKQQLDHNTKYLGFSWSTYFTLIFQNFKKSLPMLIFGFVRFVSVKGLEYQEHVTEYGIHWNFFFTIGLLPIFIAILDPLFQLIPRFLVASLITIVHEISLNQGLLRYILTSENRLDNIITMNKEGIFSFFGYLSIFIFGQSFGSFVMTNKPTYNNLITFTNAPFNKKKPNWLTVTTTKGLVISTIVYQLVFNIVNESTLFYSISRRLANLPYVLMIVSYNSFFLLCYNMVFRLFNVNDTNSSVLEAVNKNGLVFFLIGNLLTGLINMSINTLQCNDNLSQLIIMSYAIFIVLIAYFMNVFKIYIKI